MKNTLLSILGEAFSDTDEKKKPSPIGGTGTGLGKRKAEQNFNRAGYSIEKENSVFRHGIREERAPQSKLEQLAREDTNIDALLGWGLIPRIEDGKLKLKGAAKLAPEALDGLKRWLAHIGPNGEARREQIIRALTTGRKATC